MHSKNAYLFTSRKRIHINNQYHLIGETPVPYYGVFTTLKRAQLVKASHQYRKVSSFKPQWPHGQAKGPNLVKRIPGDLRIELEMNLK